ncbi:MAG: hypothetical protein ACR2GP_12845, partial [Burkholderiaceae bacterium]
FAREAAAAGRATVLIDGSAGEVAMACGAGCRYELAHVLAGDKALSDVVKVLTPHLLLLPAARALSRFGSFTADEEARLSQAFATGIAETFMGAGTQDVQVDLIVVNAEHGEALRAVEAFGRDARVVMVASDQPASMRGAYAEMKSLSQDRGLENFEIVVPASGDAAGAGIVFTNLANAARRFLEIELVDGGAVPVVAEARALSTGLSNASARHSPLSMRASTNSAASELSASAVAAASSSLSTHEVSHAANA